MSKNIYVGNLSYQTDEEALRTLFSAYGAVKSVSVIKDRYTGESRGFGFVEMDDDTEAQAAIDGLNGADCEGRSLKVNEAKPRAERSGGGRDRGRGGYGGGGGYRGGR